MADGAGPLAQRLAMLGAQIIAIGPLEAPLLRVACLYPEKIEVLAMDLHDLVACRRLARLWGGRAGAWADQPDALCRPDWACATGAGSGGLDIAPGLGGRAGGGGMRGPRTRPSRCPAHRHTGPNCCQRRATPAGGGAVCRPSAPYGAVGAGARAAGHYGGAGGHGAGLGLGGQRAAAGGFMRRTPPQPCRGVFSFAARRAIRLTCAVAVLNPARTKGWVQ